jgi:hypothetical protein
LYPPGGVSAPSSRYELKDREFILNDHRFYRALVSTSCQPANNIANGLVVSDSVLSLYEGQTVNFTFQLASPPVGTVTVTVARSEGSTNIILLGNSNVTFDASNWNIPQPAFVFAGADSHFENSKATFMITSNQTAVATVRVLAVNSDIDDEFVGPFPSWMNVKRDFGARGDGSADDTTAIQTALNALRPYTNKAVLYFPAGTYRITQSLNMTRTADSEFKDIMVFGEDPTVTTLQWDGASNQVMFVYGAWYAKMSRLTFDGAGKAMTAIAHSSNFSTINEFSDITFKDLAFGIEAGTPIGQGNAETAVERCKFVRCARAAVSIQNPNSLDWFIWNSEFDDCGLGVSNTYGAGNYHVYECLFRHSTQADMSIGNTGYFSIRDNTSIGSAAFFVASPVPSCGLVTLQNNTVLSPKGTPIQFGNLGPLVLLDNNIEDFQGRAASVEPSAGFVSVGNTFTVSNAIPAGFDGPAGIRLDDSVACKKLFPSLPLLPGPLPAINRPTIEILAPTNAAGLQAAITAAAAFAGQKPIIHLPLGTCLIDQTVAIPAGCDLQLVGDGSKSALRWAGLGAGPVLQFAAPVRATLRDFIIFGFSNTNQADAILVQNCDQANGRIYFDQVNIYRAQQNGLFVDGLAQVSVALKNFYHEENQVSVRVKGNGSSGPFTGAAGQVAIFGGASALNGVTYDVSNGGKLLARDIWYEATGTNSSPRFMICTNSGYFTLHGANVSPTRAGLANPAVLVSNFVGQLTFLTTEFTASNCVVAVQGNTTNSVLLLGTVNSNDPKFNSPQAASSLLQSFQSFSDGSFDPMTDKGPYSADFLRTMLAQTRNGNPPTLRPLPAGITDFRMHRVQIEGGRIGIHLQR